MLRICTLDVGEVQGSVGEKWGFYVLAKIIEIGARGFPCIMNIRENGIIEREAWAGK